MFEDANAESLSFLLAGSALFDRPKFLLHSRIGKQILAPDFLASGCLANQYSNVRIEVGSFRFSSCHSSLFQIWFGFASAMGKKKNQSLTERIAALINRVGEKPEPTFGYIKSALVDCLGIAETLENGAAVRDAEAKITALEAALEKSDTELGELKGEMQTAKAEIESFRAEQKKREEKEREIAPIQLKMLRSLPSEYEGKGLNMSQIAYAASVRVDETEVYVNGLKKLGLVIFQHHEPGGGSWRRTEEGNKLVVAKRWAGEEEKEEIKTKRSKHGELSHPEEIALLTMAKSMNEGATEPEIAKVLKYTAAQTAFILLMLSQKNMAAASNEPDYGTGSAWFILNNGLEHLAERRLLP